MITNITITSEENEIVSLPAAKLQLRLETSYTDEDTLIQRCISAAVINSENYINGHIFKKEVEIVLDTMPTSFELHFYPIREISSITYHQNGSSQTLPPSKYYLQKANQKQAVLIVNEVPEVDDRKDAVTITLQVGFEEVPEVVVQAVLLQVSDMYERREDRMEVVDTTAKALLRPYRYYE